MHLTKNKRGVGIHWQMLVIAFLAGVALVWTGNFYLNELEPVGNVVLEVSKSVRLADIDQVQVRLSLSSVVQKELDRLEHSNSFVSRCGTHGQAAYLTSSDATTCASDDAAQDRLRSALVAALEAPVRAWGIEEYDLTIDEEAGLIVFSTESVIASTVLDDDAAAVLAIDPSFSVRYANPVADVDSLTPVVEQIELLCGRDDLANCIDENNFFDSTNFEYLETCETGNEKLVADYVHYIETCALAIDTSCKCPNEPQHLGVGLRTENGVTSVFSFQDESIEPIVLQTSIRRENPDLETIQYRLFREGPGQLYEQFSASAGAIECTLPERVPTRMCVQDLNTDFVYKIVVDLLSQPNTDAVGSELQFRFSPIVPTPSGANGALDIDRSRIYAAARAEQIDYYLLFSILKSVSEFDSVSSDRNPSLNGLGRLSFETIENIMPELRDAFPNRLTGDVTAEDVFGPMFASETDEDIDIQIRAAAIYIRSLSAEQQSLPIDVETLVESYLDPTTLSADTTLTPENLYIQVVNLANLERATAE